MEETRFEFTKFQKELKDLFNNHIIKESISPIVSPSLISPPKVSYSSLGGDVPLLLNQETNGIGTDFLLSELNQGASNVATDFSFQSKSGRLFK